MVEFKSTNYIQSKYKSGKPYHTQSKLPHTNFSTILNNISTQKFLIMLINIITIFNSKVKNSASEPNLIKASNKHKNKNINMSKAGLIEQKPI